MHQFKYVLKIFCFSLTAILIQSKKYDFLHPLKQIKYDFHVNKSIIDVVNSHEQNFDYEELFSEILNPSKNFEFYLPDESTPKISLQCLSDIQKIKSAVKKGKLFEKKNLWILRMFDSWGRYEGGVLQGNRRYLGFYDECLSITVNQNKEDVGSYCYVAIGRAKKEEESDDEIGKKKSGNAIKTIIASKTIMVLASLPGYGTCIPSSCQTEVLRESLDKAFQAVGFRLQNVNCQSKVDKVHYDVWNICGIVVFSILGLILVAASIFDMINPQFPINTNLRLYIKAFSVPENLSKIFQLRTSNSPDVISCLHGIRFMSIAWVVMGHQYAFAYYYSSNLPAKMSQPFLFQTISNADKSVDTFFVLSGLLVSFHFFRNMEKRKSFPWIEFYLLRFVRLAPPIAAVMFFVASISGLLATGPLEGLYKSTQVESCRTYWWLDWTFLSNFVSRFWGDKLKEITGQNINCLGQCWYTSVDTQLYIFMPFILIPLWRMGKKGLAWLGLWTFLSFLIQAVLYGIGYPDVVPILMNNTFTVDMFMKIYIMPYCRASPYLIGIWTGYILYKYTGKKVVLSTTQVAIGWITATAVAIFVLFGIQNFNEINFANPVPLISQGYSVFYGTFERGLWGAAIAWVILACQWGYGGMVNSFLSYPAFQPLSRLTYGIYLVHIFILSLLIMSAKRMEYYSNVNELLKTVSLLLVSGMGALLLTLAIESPIINIQKLIMNKSSKTKKLHSEIEVDMSELRNGK